MDKEVEEAIKNLNAKQKRFCEEYLIDLNATQAYKRAGYIGDGAKESASRLLTKVNVQTYIARLKKKRSEKVGISSNEVLRRLRDFAMGDVTKTMTLTVEEFQELPDEVRLCISRFETFTKSYEVEEETIKETTVKVWFVDKLKAWDMINKHIGFYEKDNDQKRDNVVMFKLPDNGRGKT